MLLTIRRQDAADALPHADRSADRSIAHPRIEGYHGITAVAPLQEANNAWVSLPELSDDCISKMLRAEAGQCHKAPPPSVYKARAGSARRD